MLNATKTLRDFSGAVKTSQISGDRTPPYLETKFTKPRKSGEKMSPPIRTAVSSLGSYRRYLSE